MSRETALSGVESLFALEASCVQFYLRLPKQICFEQYHLVHFPSLRT